MQIEWIESQFFDPGKNANAMIIIHHTGSTNGQINSFEGTINWFKPAVWRSTNQASAQYIIAREERPIVQMVRDEDTAWHAGRSSWEINGVLRESLNSWSIGIELQGDGALVPYTAFQYEALIWLLKKKMKQFRIPVELIRGHQEVSPWKPDPGPLFDWNRVRRALGAVSVPGADFPDDDTSGGELVDEDGDGIIYIDETDDVYIPSGRDRNLVERFFDWLSSLFRK
ncbi:MAG: N-acetylmuramoyl-L-alanine amidase [candidate division KSB1 bacterium]|nr:N-acetylmuramoyl-L-alanine amidase [candidate division KSB1 bacterium]MDZ7317825.1 N-acetylmuramoyl-L-alanine amidase [candidate division KSB1 bacterium]MDZ7341910.1 N-acetylmuramoyl-L-alanine amidase [candidate division KSB1 bacterium]